MNIEIRQVSDGVTPELNRIAREIGGRRVMAACGKELEIGLREHFAALERKGNAKGWPRRHFWNRQVAEKTALTQVTNERAVVTVDSPEYAHKLKGGTIKPKRGRALAIPATAQAYAAGSPRELDSDFLDFQPVRTSRGDLIGLLKRRRHSDLASRQERGGEVWYWLLRKVTHQPDPAAYPDTRKLSTRIVGRARAVYDRVMQKR